MRIQGMGGRNLSLKDHNNGDSVALINMRTGEKREYTWNRLLEVWRHLVSGGATYQEAWQQLYGKPWPEERKIAPVQPTDSPKEKKPEKRKESRVTKANTEPKKKPKEPEKKPEQMTIPGAAPDPAPKEPETQVTDSCSGESEQKQNTDTMDTEEQVPGQTDLESDFPQYCPSIRRYLSPALAPR